jgi:hypothetical protein
VAAGAALTLTRSKRFWSTFVDTVRLIQQDWR